MRLKKGMKAPPFSLRDGEGKMHSLPQYASKTVVLYFYPKDDTPGCAQEACEFRDHYAQALKRGIVILGVSPDDEQSHLKFAKKFSLPFPLLCDAGHELASLYGAWGKKRFMGREYNGVIRSTFVIGPDGAIMEALYGVKPAGHAKEVLGKI